MAEQSGRADTAGLPGVQGGCSAYENGLLALWDAVMATATDERAAGRGLDLATMIDLVQRHRGVAQPSDWVAGVQRLAAHIAPIQHQLEQALAQWELIKGIKSHALGQLDQSLPLLQKILAREAGEAGLTSPARDADQKRWNFLKENRLFFRTVFLQMDALRARLDHLEPKESLLNRHSVDLGRDLEKQAVMLHDFLQNSLDFLENRGDGAGLTAALAALSSAPAVGQTAVPVTSAPVVASPLTRSAPATVTRTAESVDALVDRVRERCLQAKQVLLQMSLWEWDLLKKPIPPPELLRAIRTQQPAVDRACLAVEEILESLERLTRWHDGELGVVLGSHLSTLEKLQGEADDALEQLHTLFDRVSLPAHVDRRSQLAVTRFLQERAAKRRAGLPLPSEQRTDASSRRVDERIAVRCRIEVQSLEGGVPILGVTRDVSTKGFCLEADGVPGGVASGMLISFKILSDAQRTLFFGTLYRTSGTLLVILLDAGCETQFMTLIRAEILQNREEGAGILPLKPTTPS